MGEFPELIDNRQQTEQALDSGDARRITSALAQMIYFETDLRWLHDQYLHFLHYSDPQVRALAAMKLGDIALFHKKSESRAVAALKELLHDPEPSVADSAKEAIEMISYYVADLNEDG